jgi:hypothetical protein
MISIISQPTNNFTPVYNNIIFGLSSSTVNQPNYRYVSDLFINDTFVNRLKTFPDMQGYGLLRLNRVIQDYISYQLQEIESNQSTLFYGNDNCIKNIKLKLYDEYGDLTSGTTIYTSTTINSDNYMVFNGALSYYGDFNQNYTSQKVGVGGTKGTNYFTDFDYKDYVADKFSDISFNPLFLTNIPRKSLIKCSLGDTKYISIFVDKPDMVSELYVETFDINNNNIGTYRYSNTTNNNPQLTGSSSADCLITIGVGPIDINSRQYGVNALTVPPINTNVSYYTVQTRYVNPGNPNDIETTSEIITITLDNSTNYQKFKFRFLNIFGVFDSFVFNGRNSQTKRKTNTTEYTKILGVFKNGVYSYPNGDKGLTNIYSTIENDYKVFSNWINEKESIYLSELFTSPVVFLEVSQSDPKLILNTTNNSTLLQINYNEPHYYQVDDIIAIFDCDNTFSANTRFASVVNVLSETSVLIAESFYNISNGYTTALNKTTKLIPIEITNTNYNIKQTKPRLINIDISFKLSNDDPRQSGVNIL